MTWADLPDFMEAVARTESGFNYTLNDGERVGAYGIPNSKWADYAALAGVPDADWRDPDAQDRVAGTIFAELYRRTQSWPLVAIAWRAGMEAVNQAVRHGIQSERFRKVTAGGESVAGYADTIVGKMRATPRMELPNRDDIALAPGEPTRPEKRRRKVEMAGLALLRSTKGRPATDPNVAPAELATEAPVIPEPNARPLVEPEPNTPGVEVE